MIIIICFALPFLLLYLLIFTPIDIIRYFINKRRFRHTLGIIPSLGYIVGVSGHIGAGKSTLTAGMTTYMESYLIGIAYQTIDYVQTIVNKLNFNIVNEILDSQFFDEKIDTLKERVFPEIIDYLYYKDKYSDEYVGDLTYFDGIKTYTYEFLLERYIEAYMAIKRNNYVFCNIKFDSVITGKRAFDFNEYDFQIKNRLVQKDYRPRRYAVYYSDEETLSANKFNLNWQQMEDSGTVEHRRIHRHLFRETGYNYNTLQNPERLVKAERELFNSIIMINNKTDYSQFKRLKRVIGIFDSMNEFCHNTKVNLKEKIRINEDPNKPNLYKKVKKAFMKWSDALNGKDYLIYEVSVYDTAKEAENGSRNAYVTKFVLPKRWCYGPIDTFEYSYQYDAAVAVSKVSPTPKKNDILTADKIQLATDMLKKKEKKVKEPTKSKNEKIVIGGTHA